MNYLGRAGEVATARQEDNEFGVLSSLFIRQNRRQKVMPDCRVSMALLEECPGESRPESQLHWDGASGHAQEPAGTVARGAWVTRP